MKIIFEIALSLVKNVGATKHRDIINAVGSAEAFFELTKDQLDHIGVEPFSKDELLATAKKVIEKNKKLGVSSVCYGDDDYPESLHNLPQAPPYFFYVGDYSLVSADKKVGIVGTRHMTMYGREVSEKLAKECVMNDVVTISGLASGVDGVVHKSTLKSGGKTIAVIGSGFMYQYPKSNALLYNDIVKKGGLIISEFLPDVTPLPHNFLRRNRIVAGLSDCIVVVESKIKGGSLNTVNHALELGKEIFAVPGSIFNEQSDGCNKLIYDGASMINRGYKDIDEAMGWSVGYQTKVKEADTTAKKRARKKIEIIPPKLDLEIVPDVKLDDVVDDKIYQYIKGNSGVHIDQLVKNLGVAQSTLLAKLTTLELKDIITSLPGMKYKVVS